jgi:signal peptidase I
MFDYITHYMTGFQQMQEVCAQGRTFLLGIPLAFQQDAHPNENTSNPHFYPTPILKQSSPDLYFIGRQEHKICSGSHTIYPRQTEGTACFSQTYCFSQVCYGMEYSLFTEHYGGLMKPTPTTHEKRNHLALEIAETVFLTLLMFLVIRFAIQNFNIDGTSMEPSLHNTELVLVDKWSYLFHAPTRGDIIIFHAPPEPTQDYVKRIIGLPGDIITVKGTTVIVDGVKLSETYVAPQDQGVPPGARTITNRVVPANDYFVLGDNRAVSSDSRIWGFVPRQNIIGRAAFVYWPLGADNSGLVPGVNNVFANIHTNDTQNTSPFGALAAHLNVLWLLLIPALLLAFLQRKHLKRWLRSPRPNESNPNHEATGKSERLVARRASRFFR